MTDDEPKQYADRDIIAIDKAGGYYCRHVSAMTGEGLHAKSDIAAELAYRDLVIDSLHALLAEFEAELTTARVEKADVWDDGFSAGRYDTGKHNPYRKESTDG